MKRCPKCSTVLYRKRLESLEVDGCPGCGGVWLDAGEFDSLVRLGPGVLSKIEAAVEPVQPAPQSPTNTCPACQSPLEQGRQSSLLAGVGFLKCPACRGYWFDNQQLAQATAAIFPETSAPLPASAPVARPDPAPASDPALLDRRTFFVGDRVTWSQVAFLIFTGLLVKILEKAGVADAVVSYGWIAGLLVVLVAMGIIKKTRHSLYFERHWLSIFWLMLSIWAGVTVYAGVLAGSYVGEGNALVVSLVVAFMNLAGYYLARLIRKLRHSISRARLKSYIALFAFVWMGILGWLGVTLILQGLQECDISWSLSNARTCQTCLVGIYLIIVGLGMVISMLINIFMLHCLFDPKGLDVEENTPNELYLKMMIGSLIITFIAWVLLMFLVPPVAGGGGGGGKRSSSRSGSSGRSTRSGTGRYSSFGGYGLGPVDGERIEEEWAEHGLDKP